MRVLSRSAIVEACDQHGLQLRFHRVETCSNCSLGSVCATPGLRRVAAIVPGHPVRGSSIRFTIESGLLGRIAALGYLLPAVLMVCGAGLGTLSPSFSGDGGALVGAGAGLVLGGVLLRLYDARHGSGLWRVEPESRNPSAAMR